ncbi:MAG: helix-turn-helix domain-containing protein [Pseudonocardia sp.]
MTGPGRDRLRELIDAVLDEDHRTLRDMAQGAYASPFHFSRRLARDAGEPPVAMRRRVALERAAWRLGRGVSVTEAAFEAGYGSVEGFARAYSRAYGHPPSDTPPAAAGPGCPHWLPAPNGIHFHSPDGLWVEGPGGTSAAEVTALLVHQDVDDVRALVDLAKGLDTDAYALDRLPGFTLLHWAGPEGSIKALLNRCVGTYAIWLASIEGADHPGRIAEDSDPAELIARLDTVAPRWLRWVRDTQRRRAWGDRLVDALCDPPESFVLGSVLAHVLVYSAQRRGLARALLRQAGIDVGEPVCGHGPPDPVRDGDPIEWLRRHAP